MVVEQQAFRNNENCRCCSQASTKAATPLASSVQPVVIQKARLAEQSREMVSVEAWRDSHQHHPQQRSERQQKQRGQHQLRHRAKKEPAVAAEDTLAAQEDMPAVAVAAAAAEIRLPMDTPRQILAQVARQAALRTAPAWP